MKKLFRYLLKHILGKISRGVITKHNAEVIVVIGWTGSSIVREMIYNELKEEFNVRRNTREVWWDLSVPLAILGYKDKRRDIFSWIYLIIRSSLSLVFRKRYAHKIVINIDTSYENIAKFWSRYIKPDIVVMLKENPGSKLIKKILHSDSSERILFVYNPELFSGFKAGRVREFIFTKKVGDLVYSRKKDILFIRYKNKEIKVRIPQGCAFIWELIPAAISVGILEGIEFTSLKYDLSKFNFHPRQLNEGMKQLKKFLHREVNEK